MFACRIRVRSLTTPDEESSAHQGHDCACLGAALGEIVAPPVSTSVSNPASPSVTYRHLLRHSSSLSSCLG
jgi:hypothetical protein